MDREKMATYLTSFNTPPPIAARFHNLTGVTVADLLKAGGRFSPSAGVWTFPDSSRGQFLSPRGMIESVFKIVKERDIETSGALDSTWRKLQRER